MTMPTTPLAVPLVVPVVASAAFGVLAVLTIGAWAPLDAVDTAISETFRTWGAGRPGLISVVRVATDVATTIPYLTAGLLAATTLWVRRQRPAARFVAATAVSVPVLWSLMHLLLVHARPVDGFVTVASNGFPSGHTSNAAAAALVVVILVRPRSHVGRVVLVTVALAVALFIGVTRLILLAHWPSDVLGGWLLVLAVVPALAAVTVGAGRPSRTVDE
jgi:membrane-associated phospholipid phosphatase